MYGPDRQKILVFVRRDMVLSAQEDIKVSELFSFLISMLFSLLPFVFIHLNGNVIYTLFPASVYYLCWFNLLELNLQVCSTIKYF